MKGLLKATAKGKWVYLLALCWCYLCSMTQREMRDFILLPGAPFQGFGTSVFILSGTFFFHLRKCASFFTNELYKVFFFCCCWYYRLGLVWFFILILRSWSLGTVVYFGGLGVWDRVIKGNEFITHVTCNNSLWSTFENRESKWMKCQFCLISSQQYSLLALYPITIENMLSHFFISVCWEIYVCIHNLMFTFYIQFLNWILFRVELKEWLWFIILYVYNWVHFMAQLKKENNVPGKIIYIPYPFKIFVLVISLHFKVINTRSH